MRNREVKMKPLAASILSLSLLTVMAGAAVAPALEVIRRHFSDASQLEVQLVVCMPALFIVITNMFFGRLASRFGARTLTMVGLALYTVGGAAAGLFNSIWAVLVMRALVGVGVGIIMPLSTGLLTYYFAPEKREGLMGLSSAANQLGGVVATLLAGVLANISWRLSFLVYLMGLISIVLCLIFMPNDRIRSVESSGAEKGGSGGVWRRNWGYILCMFLLMTAFFIYPANFAIVTAAEGAIPMSLCAVIMAGTDLVAFGGGLAFVWVKRVSGKCARLVAPLLFLIGYCLLAFVGGWVGTIAGSAHVGFANGVGVPFIISSASANEGKAAATTVMPLISASLYLSQFLSPFILSLVSGPASGAVKLPYYLAVGVSAAFLLFALFAPGKTMNK